MDLEQALIRVQCAYPKIYLACHSRHQNARTTEVRLSQRDSTILAHLHDATPMGQGALARHMGVAKSTFSEAIDELVRQGYVGRNKQGRSIGLLRTSKGTRAMSGSSVLETARLRKQLAKLGSADLTRAIEGLEILAEAKG